MKYLTFGIRDSAMLQGYIGQMKVLKGMKRILVRGPKVLIEIHPRELTEFNSSEQEVCDWLQSFGYSWSVINNGDKKNKLLLAIKEKVSV